MQAVILDCFPCLEAFTGNVFLCSVYETAYIVYEKMIKVPHKIASRQQIMLFHDFELIDTDMFVDHISTWLPVPRQ